jgi:hypothetical protein
MGRYLLLWLLGIPIPILLLIWFFRDGLGHELRDGVLETANIRLQRLQVRAGRVHRLLGGGADGILATESKMAEPAAASEPPRGLSLKLLPCECNRPPSFSM